MRAVVSLAAMLVTLCGLSLVLLGEGPRRAGGERPEDFVHLYVPSWDLRHGRPVYDPTITAPELERALGWSYRSELAFANPPGSVPFVYPVSFLSYAAAWWTLLVASCVALVLAIVLTAREVGFARLPAWTAGVLFLCAPPNLALLVLNHVEGLVVLLAVLGWIALRRRRLASGGAFWGICAAFKLFPALWLVPLLRRENRRAGWAAIAVALLVTGIGAVMLGPAEIVRFVRDVLPQSARWQESYANHSLLALGVWLGSPALGWTMAFAVCGLAVAALGRGPTSADRMLVVAVPASLLGSPLAWSYYFAFAAPCVIVLASHLDLRRGRARAGVYVLCLLLFLWPSLLGGWSEGLVEGAPWVVALVYTFAPTAALLALMSLGIKRVDRPAADPARLHDTVLGDAGPFGVLDAR